MGLGIDNKSIIIYVFAFQKLGYTIRLVYPSLYYTGIKTGFLSIDTIVIILVNEPYENTWNYSTRLMLF